MSGREAYSRPSRYHPTSSLSRPLLEHGTGGGFRSTGGSDSPRGSDAQSAYDNGGVRPALLRFRVSSGCLRGHVLRVLGRRFSAVSRLSGRPNVRVLIPIKGSAISFVESTERLARCQSHFRSRSTALVTVFETALLLPKTRIHRIEPFSEEMRVDVGPESASGLVNKSTPPLAPVAIPPPSASGKLVPVARPMVLYPAMPLATPQRATAADVE